MSAKKPKSKWSRKEKDKYDDKIESSHSFDKPKKVGQDKEVEIFDEPKQPKSSKKIGMNLELSFFHVMK